VDRYKGKIQKVDSRGTLLLFAKIKHWHPKAERKENQDNQLHFSLLNVSILIFLILAIALNN
jgi:hypothetical protein